MAEHAHYDDDAGFWEEHADRLGGPVVDLGAAVGRVTIRVALQGHEVWAVDTDREMLDVLAERALRAGVRGLIHAVPGSMTDPLPVSDAGLVMVPMNTLQLLRQRSDQVRCLASAASGLRAGGEMIFDLAMPHLRETRALQGEILDTGRGLDGDTGDVLLHTTTFDEVTPATGEVRMRIVVDRIHRDGSRTSVERPHHLHLYDPDEIPALALDAGLEVVAACGGFRGEPLGPDSDRHVWRLRRPGP